MIDINDVCDYVIVRAYAAGASLNVLKLQKLLYYVQAWNLALRDKPLFSGRFQAWVHGPVNRCIYDRFKGNKSLYSDIRADDVRPGFESSKLSEEDRGLIDSVLEVYAKYTGTQLEEMTHRELPWTSARVGFSDSQRCETNIDEAVMKSFYKARLAN